MATTFVQPGNVIEVTAPAGGATSGVGLLKGQLFGVALNDALINQTVRLAVRGTFEIAKTSALAIDVGDALYWDNTNKEVNKTSAAQKEVGVAVSDAADPSDTVLIRLIPTIRTSVAA